MIGFNNQGWAPSNLQYIVPFSSFDTYSYPPFSTFFFLMAKKRDGSWHDLSLKTPFPAGSGNHCWFNPLVLSHWTTLEPLSFFYYAISRHKLLKTLWIVTPLPCLTNLHLWFHLLFFSHWHSLSPALRVEFGTSRAFPDISFTITALPCIVGLFTCSNLKSWASLFGSKFSYLRIPSKDKAYFPLLSVLIQKYLWNAWMGAATTAKSWSLFCFPALSLIYFPYSSKTRDDKQFTI